MSRRLVTSAFTPIRRRTAPLPVVLTFAVDIEADYRHAYDPYQLSDDLAGRSAAWPIGLSTAAALALLIAATTLLQNRTDYAPLPAEQFSSLPVSANVG